MLLCLHAWVKEDICKFLELSAYIGFKISPIGTLSRLNF